MNASGTVKAAFTLAWFLLAASLLMVVAVSDNYPGGYEAMLGQAGNLFVASTVLCLAALVAAVVWKRTQISPVWLILGGLQALASFLIILIVFLLSGFR